MDAGEVGNQARRQLSLGRAFPRGILHPVRASDPELLSQIGARSPVFVAGFDSDHRGDPFAPASGEDSVFRRLSARPCFTNATCYRNWESNVGARWIKEQIAESDRDYLNMLWAWSVFISGQQTDFLASSATASSTLISGANTQVSICRGFSFCAFEDSVYRVEERLKSIPGSDRHFRRQLGSMLYKVSSRTISIEFQTVSQRSPLK